MPNELGYCEIYKPRCHGILYNGLRDSPIIENNIKYIYSSLLYLYGITPSSFLNKHSVERLEWENTVENQYSFWRHHDHRLNYNPLVRNTSAVAPNCLHIIERIYHEDYEFCIIKTFWLKIIQRKWKRWYYNMLAKRKNPRNLMRRQIYGKWVY
jgi:hypothetical protein